VGAGGGRRGGSTTQIPDPDAEAAEPWIAARVTRREIQLLAAGWAAEHSATIRASGWLPKKS
jgi:hypothetical protein